MEQPNPDVALAGGLHALWLFCACFGRGNVLKRRSNGDERKAWSVKHFHPRRKNAARTP
jgi:hypothetical protein